MIRIRKKNAVFVAICILCIFHLSGCYKVAAPSVTDNNNSPDRADEVFGPIVYTISTTDDTDNADNADNTEEYIETETENKTEPLTEPSTAPSTETPTEPPTVPTTAPPTEPPTASPTAALTATPTESPTPPPTLPPAIPPVTETKTVKHTEVFKSTRELDKTKPMIAITFDDGPSKYTAEIVDKFVEYQSAATFFVVGTQVEKFPETLKYIADSGCEIGNHTRNHKSLAAISFDDIDFEINSMQELVFSIAGVYPMLIRPPYGAVTPEMKAYIGYPLVLWSVDTNDWKYKDVERTVDYVMNAAADGEIILLHDLYETTKDAALIFIPKLIEAGYQLVTVTELYEAKGYAIEAGNTYSRAK